MKKLISGVVLAVLVVAAGTFAYFALFQGASDEPVWTISSYSGEVLVTDGGDDWRPAQMKMRLRGSDRIKTLSDGMATLVHGMSHIAIEAETEITVAELRPGLSDFSVALGGVVRVEARGSRIRATSVAGHVADTDDAGFGMSVSKDGLAVVKVNRGEIDFRSGGHTERVKEGEQSEARAGRPPSRPVRIPRNLLLNVRFPDADTFNTRLARIEGRAEAGARVYVGDRLVDTEADGTFSTEVELHEGTNQIEVRAVDAINNKTSEQSQPIRVDTVGPGLSDASIGRRSVEDSGR
jgi:hypothetical protein